MQIKDLQIITHMDTHRPKGVFVEFATPDELNSALQAQGTVSPAVMQHFLANNLLSHGKSLRYSWGR